MKWISPVTERATRACVCTQMFLSDIQDLSLTSMLGWTWKFQVTKGTAGFQTSSILWPRSGSEKWAEPFFKWDFLNMKRLCSATHVSRQPLTLINFTSNSSSRSNMTNISKPETICSPESWLPRPLHTVQVHRDHSPSGRQRATLCFLDDGKHDGLWWLPTGESNQAAESQHVYCNIGAHTRGKGEEGGLLVMKSGVHTQVERLSDLSCL